MLAYATYCSAQKNFSKEELPAMELYDSQRITNIARRAKKDNICLYILSGKYGLLKPSQKIAHYDHLLTLSEVETHSRSIAIQLRSNNISKMMFFTHPLETDPNLLPYLKCIGRACEIAKITMQIEIISHSTI